MRILARTLFLSASLLLAAAPALAAPALFMPAARADTAMPKAVTRFERGVVRARAVDVDFAIVNAMRDALAPSDSSPVELLLPLFDDAPALVALTRREDVYGGGVAWHGYILGKPYGSVTFVENAGFVAANLTAPGFTYQLRYAPGGHYEARQIDQGAFSDHGELKPIEVGIERASRVHAADATDMAPFDMAAAKATPKVDSAAFIDVLVAYTATARAAAGGPGPMATLVTLAQTETNDAYLFAGVAQRLRVTSMEVNYAETGDMNIDLGRLKSKGDGFLDEIHIMRDAVAADAVSLWVENGGTGCGLGYFMSTVQSTFEVSAFNVVARGCATGNYSFGHELGHNMGLRHDVYMDNGTTPFPTAHGYVDVAHLFRTIMAYNDKCTANVPSVSCTRIKAFSNPAVTYNTFTTGDALTANAAAVLNATAPTVANFRDSTLKPAGGAVGFLYDAVTSVSEGAGTKTINVYRMGNSAGSASVQYATANGTATAGADYVATSGMLNWGNGDTAPKPITIPILQDGASESLETFTVTLSSPSGVAIATGAGTSTITIVDDEPDAFPLSCVMPAGFVTSAGATSGWAVDNTVSFEGQCSLKSAAMANSAGVGQFNKAQVQLTYDFGAGGTIAFRYKVSSEAGWDCLRFLVDDAQQNLGNCTNNGGLGASGEVPFTLFSMPIAGGVHVLKWSYEKDNAVVAGADAAWIDAYAFTPTVVSTDVAVTLGASSASPGTGKDLVYTANVTNAGPGTATAVSLNETIPAGTTFIWASPGCSNGGASVTCSIGTLASGASAQVKLVVRPAAAASITSTATVSASSSDPTPANNTASSTLTTVTSAAGVQVQRYRLYSPVTNEHLYTTDLNEYNVLGSFVGTWNKEGPVGKVLNNPGSLAGVTATPYYRLYNTSNAQHHWTTDANEYYTLILFPQYNAEGVDGFIFPMQAAGTIPLYRLLYPFTVPVSGLHHWTIDPVEYNALIASFGWIGEGGSGFVIP